MDQQKHMQEQIQTILSQQHPSTSSPGMQHSSEGSTTCLEWATILEKPTQCELIHGSTRLACAKGMVYPIGDGILHSVPMKASCVKVQIDMVYDGFGDFDLPVHNEELETLKDANGAYIQWPQTDVLLKVSKMNVAKPTLMVEKSQSQKFHVQNEDIEVHSKRQKLPQKSKVNQSINVSMPAKMRYRPIELQRFYSCLNSNDEWRRMGVTVEAEKGVFGAEGTLIALSYDDLYDLLRQRWLESGIIAAYMSGLHLLLSQKPRNNRCAFIHPDSISDL
uniref:uncharacterized protein LOC122594182 n=1 Tax=Erigeron canadensis TaxID=72917 RepID=UPI001CB942B4|nr:uncharacterized protein LOC122594182 [Erigeron canadensis]